MLVAPGLEITEHPDTWVQKVRPDVLQTFESQIYGRVPDVEVGLDWSVLEEGRTEDGRRRRQLAVRFTGPHGVAKVLLLVYLPAPAGNRGPDREGAGAERGTIPAFLGLNFQGNHACTTDPGVIQVGTDLPESETGSVYYDQHASYPVPPPRGNNAAAWPFHLANERGYAVITAHYLQTGPDHPDMFHRGLLPIFGEVSLQDRPRDGGGAIAMWAWVLRRLLDGLGRGMVPEVHPGQVWAIGHSRLGKTALWAAAQDDRFAGAISNNSGRMGAAHTRPVGEHLPTMIKQFPHWFAPNFLHRVQAGEPLPVDQHQLLACIAPRPLYVASASADHHADPEGEFAAWQSAAAAWPPGANPEPSAGKGAHRDPTEVPSSGLTFPRPGEHLVHPDLPLGYHLRAGEHAVQPFDWERWLDFRDVLDRTGQQG